MKKEVCKTLFSVLFLGIFFSKMLISAIPFFFAHYDNKVINAVIMQLEMEENSEKTPEKSKELFAKDYCHALAFFSFLSPISYLSTHPVEVETGNHVQTFYPPVATPPPNV